MSPRGRRGFTVTATMVAVALFGMLLAISLSILLFGQRRSASGNVEADLQQQALAVVYRLTQEVSEAHEILIPRESKAPRPFLAIRTLDQVIVLYVFESQSGRLVRMVVDPQSWKPSEERVISTDVSQAAFRVPNLGRLVQFQAVLARKAGDKLEELPISTAIGVRGW